MSSHSPNNPCGSSLGAIVTVADLGAPTTAPGLTDSISIVNVSISSGMVSSTIDRSMYTLVSPSGIVCVPVSVDTSIGRAVSRETVHVTSTCSRYRMSSIGDYTTPFNAC